jgi:hypothetical protein
MLWCPDNYRRTVPDDLWFPWIAQRSVACRHHYRDQAVTSAAPLADC